MNYMKLASDLKYVNQGAVLEYSSENERILNGGPPEHENSENERAMTVGSAFGEPLYFDNGDGTITLNPESGGYTDNGDGTVTLHGQYTDNGDGTVNLGG